MNCNVDNKSFTIGDIDIPDNLVDNSKYCFQALMEGLAKVSGSRKRAAKEAAAHLVGSKMFYKASIS